MENMLTKKDFEIWADSAKRMGASNEQINKHLLFTYFSKEDTPTPIFINEYLKRWLRIENHEQGE